MFCFLVFYWKWTKWVSYLVYYGYKNVHFFMKEETVLCHYRVIKGNKWESWRTAWFLLIIAVVLWLCRGLDAVPLATASHTRALMPVWEQKPQQEAGDRGPSWLWPSHCHGLPRSSFSFWDYGDWYSEKQEVPLVCDLVSRLWIYWWPLWSGCHRYV